MFLLFLLPGITYALTVAFIERRCTLNGISLNAPYISIDNLFVAVFTCAMMILSLVFLALSMGLMEINDIASLIYATAGVMIAMERPSKWLMIKLLPAHEPESAE